MKGWSSMTSLTSPDEEIWTACRESSGGRLAVWDSVTSEIDRHGPTFTGAASSAPVWGSNDVIVYATPLAPGPGPERTRIDVVRSSDRLIPGDEFFARTDEAGLAMVDLASGETKQLLGAGPAPVQRRTWGPLPHLRRAH